MGISAVRVRSLMVNKSSEGLGVGQRRDGEAPPGEWRCCPSVLPPPPLLSLPPLTDAEKGIRKRLDL